MSRQARAGLPAPRQWAGAVLAGIGLPVLTVVLIAHRDRLSYATPVLLVLLVVVGVALVGGLRPAVPTAVAGGLSLNYFFTPPIHRLTVDRPQDLLVLGVYLAVAVSVSAVVDLAARRTVQAARAAAEAEALSSVAGATLGMQDTLPALLERVRTTFGASQVLMLDGTGDKEQTVAAVGAAHDDDLEQRLAAGPTGTLVVRGPRLFAEDRRVLAAFAEAAGTALEGRRLADQVATSDAMNRLRTALLAAVGHELRTPLAGAKAAVSSLLQRDITWTAAETEELLQTIDVSVDRLQDLVTNLLDASRLQVGALSVSLAPVSLDEVTARALVGLRQGNRLVVDIDETLPAVTADTGLLERVIANLVDNALRYSTGRVEVTASPGALRVIDHGPGLRGNTPVVGSDRTPGGVGLGLFVVEGFLAAMSGRLHRETTPGGGLTMAIELPA